MARQRNLVENKQRMLLQAIALVFEPERTHGMRLAGMRLAGMRAS